MRVLLQVSYDGRPFHGFARQRDRPTVQGALESAMEDLFGVAPPLAFCSRTDAGVHALAQMVAFDAPPTVPVPRLPAALNARLPESVRVVGARDAPEGYDPRRAARRKTYRYVIHDAPPAPPFFDGIVTRLRRRLDVDAMARAAEPLPGEHDFAPILVKEARPSRLRLDRVDVTRCRYLPVPEMRRGREGPFVTISLEAQRFAYRMVRSVVGLLVEVGRGRFRPEETPDVLAGRRSWSVCVMPPDGLYLVSVRLDGLD